jgi:drug/metabolite transporter (DMT)-like permease
MPSANRKTIGALLICIAATLWGFDGIVLTPRLYSLDVGYVVFMLHALPFLGMNLLLHREYREIKNLTRSDMVYFLLIALFGGALGTLAIVKALFLVQFKHLTVVALLQKLQPIFAILLAAILLRESVSRTFALWASLAIAGGYFLTFEFHLPHAAESDNIVQAALYSLLAAFSFGSATVFGKRVLYKVSFTAALLFRYGLTTIIMLLFVLVSGTFGQLQVTTGTQWLFFIIIGLTTGSGAILLYYWGLRHIRANVATICELCFPVSSIIFDYLFNGQLLSPVQWISASVMLFAIWRISVGQPDSGTDVCDGFDDPLCEAS